jgi:murein DD-endopeptidase MepM/ murein hydrolase activator NlpD
MRSFRVRTIAWSVLLMALLGLSWLLPRTIRAADPDYIIPGQFTLPWPCGEGHQVTWDPLGHWSLHKATGIAFDFAMQEGTPLFAPADGMAYFLVDERPFEANLGNYVELVTGDWMVRLAHLRDPQSGEHIVHAGELIGYSGKTGATAEHLHLEILVRDGAGWERPDLNRLERLWGLPLADLTEGAIVTRASCPAQLAIAGSVRPLREKNRLGETLDLSVPLRNDGSEPVTLDAVQVSLYAPNGTALVAKVQGAWEVGRNGSLSISVPVRPNLAGTWRIGRVTCLAGDTTFGFATEGTLDIGPSSLRLVQLNMPAILDVGKRITLEAQIENTGEMDVALDDVQIDGLQPNGTPWSASAGQASTLQAGSRQRLLLYSTSVPLTVGLWNTQQIGYQRDKQIFYFDRVEQSFAVLGPEIRLKQATIYASAKTLSVFLTITNVGTRTAIPDAITVWGWKPDGEHDFVLTNRKVAPVAPGQSALIQLDVPLEHNEGLWRLVEAGYWVSGDYYRMDFPNDGSYQGPAVTVHLTPSSERPPR